MPKLKPEELEARRTEIVEAARTCFLRSGFHQTTTDEICREANITPGGLYHYFTSKDELIGVVIEYSAKMAMERMRKVVEAADNTETAFRQAVGFLQATLTDPDIENIARLDVEIWAESFKNEKLADRNRGIWMLRLRWLEAMIESGMRDGLIAGDANKHAMASLMLAMLIGLRTGNLLLGEEFDTVGALDELLKMQAARSSFPLVSLKAS
ncbi:MAG TPA: TetR/AcrR family transcriptional regulator [Dehalococcoidia bacterium]|nr:TetR/AcrR family transcriptional regulator [Dehalococcoidia bacterium]